ncbi:TrbI/VirB10 family protein [Burkholderia stagnalis]
MNSTEPGRDDEDAGDRDAMDAEPSLNERRAAMQDLRRTSLAADPRQARKRTIYTVAALAAIGAVGAVLMTSMSSQTPAPAPATGQPKIDENAPKPAPLPHASAPATASAATPASAPDRAALEARLREEERQRQLAAAAAQQAEALRQRRLRSDLFATSAGGGDGGDAPEATSTDAGAATHKGRGPTDANSNFARAVADEDNSLVKVKADNNLQCKIRPGRILEGHLMPRIVSDLPGAITIMLDRDTYGEQGRIPLMPWGTRIVGRPNSNVQKGQERTFIATATAYLPGPGGQQIELGSNVADQLGSSGLDGDVNNHVGQILGMSAVLSLLGAGSSTVGVSGTDNANSVSTYRANVQNSLAQSSQQLLQAYANIPPTLTNPQGLRVRIQVEHELDFSAYCHPPKGDEDGNG